MGRGSIRVFARVGRREGDFVVVVVVVPAVAALHILCVALERARRRCGRRKKSLRMRVLIALLGWERRALRFLGSLW